MKSDGLDNFEVIPADVTFLVVPTSAWPASPNAPGCRVEIFERKARVMEDFKEGILGIQKEV
jgi:hypothetical protein